MANLKEMIDKYTSKEEVDKMKAKAVEITKITTEKAKEIADVIIKQADVQIQAYKERQKNKPKDDNK